MARLWRARHRIASRLVFFLTLAVLITLLTSAVAFALFAYLGKQLRQVNEAHVPQLTSAFEVAREGATLAGALPRVSASTPGDFESVVRDVNELQAAFDAHIEALSVSENNLARVAEMREAGQTMKRNVEATIAIVERRFELLAATTRGMTEISRIQEETRLRLQPLLDDQLLFAVTGYRQLTDTQSPQRRVNIEAFDAYRHLDEIEGASESAVELFSMALIQTDAVQLEPFLDAFEAEREIAHRHANLLPKGIDITDVLAHVEALFAFGEGEDSVFSLRQEILQLAALEQANIVANRAIVRASVREW